MAIKIDERLARDAITPGGDPHIIINQEACKGCDPRPCLHTCPGHLYAFVEETGEMRVEHTGCLECGTCMVVCSRDALSWRYPAGGAGIRYRFG